jgi:predicted porin
VGQVSQVPVQTKENLMQKKLLGIAVAAALVAPGLALAQSAVQVYGTVHMSLNQTKFGDASSGTVPGLTKFGVAQHASNFGLRSTETLGGGMTAWFQAEFNMLMERTNGVVDNTGSARNSGVGLRGDFGNVYYGTWETPWAQTFRLWDVGTIGGWGPTTSIIGRREQTSRSPNFNCANNSSTIGGTALTGQLICGDGSSASTAGAAGIANGNLGYALWRRFQSSVFYESPLFAGVQAKVAWLPNTSKSSVAVTTGGAIGSASQNQSAWSGSLTWTGLGGRARAFIANMQAKDWTTVGQSDSGYTAGGGYDFGVVNVGATYEDYTYKAAAGDVKAKEWGVGLAVPLGPGKIGASYAKAKKLEGAGVAASEAAGTNATDAKMLNLGYEWALSKRTQLGFGIAKIDNGANTAFTWTNQLPNANGVSGSAVQNGVNQTNLFVSIRHSF